MISLRMIFLGAALATIAWPSFADEKLEIARCAAIPDGVKRLGCYDELSQALGVDKPSIQSGSVGKWSISTETSPVDDSKNVYVTLNAESEFSGWMKHETGRLVLRCKEKRTDAYVRTGMAAQPEYGLTQEVTVTVRYDKEKAREIRMSQSTDNEALFFPNAIGEIKSMMKHKELLFRFTPFNSASSLTTFKIEGLNEAIKPLRAACKW